MARSMQASAQWRIGRVIPALLVAGLGIALSGCSSTPAPTAGSAASPDKASQTGRYSISQDAAPPPGTTLDPSQLKDAIPREEPPSRYGNPVSYKVFGKRYTTLKSATDFHETGLASWYGTKFHGHRTSSGEAYDMYAMTAAHKTLPLPTYVEVKNLDNGRSAIVRVNDRGPFHSGRIIDLSYAAAVRLGVNTKGVARVEIRALTGQRRGVAKSAAARPADVIELNVSMSEVIADSDTASTPAAGGQSGLFLQVGAFSSRGNAETLRSRLLAANMPNPSISAGQSARGTFYRLRIGPLTSRGQADALLPGLAAVGVHDTRLLEVAVN